MAADLKLRITVPVKGGANQSASDHVDQHDDDVDVRVDDDDDDVDEGAEVVQDGETVGQRDVGEPMAQSEPVQPVEVTFRVTMDERKMQQRLYKDRKLSADEQGADPLSLDGAEDSIDLNDPEAQKRRKERAKRFGTYGTPDDCVVGLEAVRELQATFGIEPNQGIGVKPMYRLNAVHVFGADELTWFEVMKHFASYMPVGVERVGKGAFNVLFRNQEWAAKLLLESSKPLSRFSKKQKPEEGEVASGDENDEYYFDEASGRRRRKRRPSINRNTDVTMETVSDDEADHSERTDTENVNPPDNNAQDESNKDGTNVQQPVVDENDPGQTGLKEVADAFIVDTNKFTVPSGRWRVCTRAHPRCSMMLLRFVSARDVDPEQGVDQDAVMFELEDDDVPTHDGAAARMGIQTPNFTGVAPVAGGDLRKRLQAKRTLGGGAFPVQGSISMKRNKIRPGLNIFDATGNELEWDYEHDTRFYGDFDPNDLLPVEERDKTKEKAGDKRQHSRSASPASDDSASPTSGARSKIPRMRMRADDDRELAPPPVTGRVKALENKRHASPGDDVWRHDREQSASPPPIVRRRRGRGFTRQYDPAFAEERHSSDEDWPRNDEPLEEGECASPPPTVTIAGKRHGGDLRDRLSTAKPAPTERPGLFAPASAVYRPSSDSEPEPEPDAEMSGSDREGDDDMAGAKLTQRFGDQWKNRPGVDELKRMRVTVENEPAAQKAPEVPASDSKSKTPAKRPVKTKSAAKTGKNRSGKRQSKSGSESSSSSGSESGSADSSSDSDSGSEA